RLELGRPHRFLVLHLVHRHVLGLAVGADVPCAPEPARAREHLTDVSLVIPLVELALHGLVDIDGDDRDEVGCCHGPPVSVGARRRRRYALWARSSHRRDGRARPRSTRGAVASSSVAWAATAAVSLTTSRSSVSGSSPAEW